MKRGSAALTAVAVLLLTGCTPELDHGRVVGKDHEDGYTTTTLTPVGKTLIPMTQYVPPSWTLHLQDGKETGDCEVTEQEYDRYEIGSWYPA